MAPKESRGTTMCMKCHQPIHARERVIVANIVEKQAADPKNPHLFGVMISGEFELVHVMCEDKQLDAHILRVK